jgi:hypothetical protein
MPTIHNLGEAVLVSLAAIFLFLPALIGAIILLVAGWFLADLVARLVGTLLRRLGFETVAQRTGVAGFITMTGARDASASHVIAELVKWFVRLIFIEMAAEVLHISAVSNLINSFILFIPNLIVALVVVMIGVLVANFVGNLVRGGAGEMGISNPNLLAGVARWAIIVFSVLVGLNQIGIAATLVNALFIAIVGAIALAAGLAFGLGGREVAGQVWQQWYRTGRGAAGRLEERAAATAKEAPTPEASAPTYETAAPPPPTPYPVRHERRLG